MTVTNSQSGTNVREISDGIYRINTPVVFESGNTLSGSHMHTTLINVSLTLFKYCT